MSAVLIIYSVCNMQKTDARHAYTGKNMCGGRELCQSDWERKKLLVNVNVNRCTAIDCTETVSAEERRTAVVNERGKGKNELAVTLNWVHAWASGLVEWTATHTHTHFTFDASLEAKGYASKRDYHFDIHLGTIRVSKTRVYMTKREQQWQWCSDLLFENVAPSD